MDYSVELRDMIPGEEKMLYKTALKSFSPVEALGASIPKHAIVAMVDGKIAGAMFLKIFKGNNGRKIGYLDLGFVQKAYRGKGIGKQMYPAAVEKLRAMGCNVITAMVKDDNIASWGLLEQQGFSIHGFVALLREFGLMKGLTLWIKTIFCISCGMNFWVSKKTRPSKSITEMLSFLAINLFFILLYTIFALVRKGGMSAYQLPGGLIVLTSSIVAGYAGTVLSRGAWRFGLTRGGMLISGVLMSLGTFFPMLGRWYPVDWQNTASQKKALGMQAACEWGLLVLFYILNSLFMVGELQTGISKGLYVLLLFRIVAVFPFEHFGGGRVFRWSKMLFVLLFACTLIGFWLL